MTMQPIGAQLILQGVPSFVAGATSATNAINNFANRIDSTGQTFQRLGQRVTEAGNFLQRTGFILSFQLTAPLVALGKSVFNASTDFETAFTEIRKNVNDAAESDFPRIEQALRDMSKQTGVSAIDLANIAGQAGQVGISAQQIIPFTETVAKLTVATNLGKEATQDLARIATLTGTDNFPALASAITYTGAQTNATEKEIVKMAVQLAGVGRVIGLTAPEVIGLSAGFGSLGIRAEHGRGAFQKLAFTISDAVVNQSEELKLFANIAGQSAEAFAISFETRPIDAILNFITGLGNINSEGKALSDTIINNLGMSADQFGRLLEEDSEGAVALYNKALRDSGGDAVELNRVLTALGFEEIRIRDLLLRSAAGHTGVTNAVKDSVKAYNQADAAEIEFQKKLKSTQGQLDILKAKIVDSAIEIGKLITPDVLEAARTFTEVIVDLAKAFVALDPQTRKTILVTGALLAAFAPVAVIVGASISLFGLLGQTFGLLIRVAPILTGYMTALLGQTVAATAALGGFTARVITSISTVGVFGTAASLMTAGITAIRLAFIGLVRVFGIVGLGIAGLALLMQVTGTEITDVMNTIIRIGGLLGAGLVQFFGTFAETIARMHSSIANTAASIARTLANLVSGLPLVGGAVSGLINKVAETAQGYANTAGQLAADIKMNTDSLSQSIIEATNAALIQKTVNEANAASFGELDLSIGDNIYEQKNFGNALVETGEKVNPFRDKIKGLTDDLLGGDGGGGKGKGLKEAAEETKLSLEDIINAMTVSELAEFARQTDINRIAQEAWQKELTNWLRSGDIESVAQAFFDVGKTGKEAFDFITEALKQIQAEGPRTSDEIVRAAKETRLLDDQWKFFESDAKRMIKEGLINEVAAQIIQMGKTGVEAIDFINKSLEALQKETEEAAKEQAKLKDEFVKTGIATEELAAKQRAASAAHLHDLKQEREELEKKRQKVLQIAQAEAYARSQINQAAREEEAGRARLMSKWMNKLTDAAFIGSWADVARMLSTLENESALPFGSQIVLDQVKEALAASGWKAVNPFMPSGQLGMTVPGSPSQGRMAYVHGSEAIIPASVRHMEFNLIDRLISAVSGMGNTFNVNANYSQMQSPSSISMDLGALMAMAKH